jgi:cupin 2 domain-containing protein
MKNLFEIPCIPENTEINEALLPDKGILIERIVSAGQASPLGFWYDQDRDEWVVLLQGLARLAWEDGRMKDMGPGDWLFIPSHEKHRVDWVSDEEKCIWLAVHGNLRG